MTDTLPLREQIARLIGYNFASLVSRNKMPDMSGDPRKRIPAHERRRFDDACEETADQLLALLPSLPDGWVDHMVQRFLGWHVPETFSPDGGVSFKRLEHNGKPYPMPTGTNVFNYTEARTMVLHMVAGLPPAFVDPTAEMIDAGAQRLASFGDDSVWPDSWSPGQVALMRSEAERVIRSAMLAARPAPPTASGTDRATDTEVDEFVTLAKALRPSQAAGD